MTPNPIRKVLFTLTRHDVKYLLMGGQACVFYGAAEFSRDTDVALLASSDNLDRLAGAMRELKAEIVAVPTLGLDHLNSKNRLFLSSLAAMTDDHIADALADEERLERSADREYWKPLRKELEQFRHDLLYLQKSSVAWASRP